jgi:plastocyanin
MRRAAVLLVALGAAVLAAPAASQHADMPGAGHDTTGARPSSASGGSATIGFDAVRPARLDIVAGESVTWTNESARTHTVTADDDSFDSGRLSTSAMFTHRFAAVGEAPYHCSLHPSIRGVVAVHELLLDAPALAAAPGRPFTLSGRAALDRGTPVSIEADTGTGFTPIASGTIGDDGGFTVRVVPEATATVRAVAGGVTSPSVNLLVLDHRVSLSERRLRGGGVRLTATVTPPARGGRIVLQLYLPERFGWWPVQTERLGRSSSAMFAVHTHRHLRARVRYTLDDGATALATSRIVHVGAARGHARPHPR